MIIAPDTSPRGEDVPDDAEGAYDFGIGAGFYVNATEEPFQKHYHMYDYITQEQPLSLTSICLVMAVLQFCIDGGMALVIGLRNPKCFVNFCLVRYACRQPVVGAKRIYLPLR